MRILQISNFFKPLWETGGVARVNYEISKNLVDIGHDVTVYTTDGYKANFELEVNKSLDVDGLNVYYFKNIFKGLCKKINLTIPYHLPIILKNEIKDYDIIHIHEHRTLSAVIVHHYAKKHGIPYVLQAHGSVLPFLQKQKLKNIFDFVVGYRILKNASKVIALNEDESLQYQKMGVDRSKVKIIPNGIDLNDFKDKPANGTFKNKYNISGNEKIVLYVGRIHQNKGIDLLVDSFAQLLNIFPDIRLVIVGPDGGFQQELEDLSKTLQIEENVLFTGFVDKNEKIAALVDANIFVTPCFSGFPISFLEACVFGLPIITTVKGDNLDWIHNKVGYVVQYDKMELCNAIFSVLDDDTLGESFSIESKRLVENRFSMKVYMQNIEKMYKECIENNLNTNIKDV